MNEDGLQLCRTYVSALGAASASGEAGQHPLASITISREAGARGRTIGRKLAMQLNSDRTAGSIPWTLFDGDLMKQVFEDHQLGESLARFFPETRWSEYDDIVGSLLKLHPDHWTVSKYTVDTIRRLGRSGHAIIVGRGSHLVTVHLPNVLKVRFVGSLPERVAHLRASRGMGESDARSFIDSHDRGRSAYLKQHFGHDIADAHDYSLVINTDHVKDDEVVRMLVERVQRIEA